MPRQTDRSSGPKNGTIFLTALLAALGVGAMATYISRSPDMRTVPPEMRRAEPDKPTASAPVDDRTSNLNSDEKPVKGVSVRLPVLKNDSVDLSDKPTQTPYPIKEVAKAALEVAGMDGIELMGASFKDGTVVLDFNAKLSEGVGSMQEGRFIDALTLGLRQIQGAKQFRLFAEGKPVETLGHFEFGQSVSLKEGEEPQP